MQSGLLFLCSGLIQFSKYLLSTYNKLGLVLDTTYYKDKLDLVWSLSPGETHFKLLPISIPICILVTLVLLLVFSTLLLPFTIGFFLVSPVSHLIMRMFMKLLLFHNTRDMIAVYLFMPFLLFSFPSNWCRIDRQLIIGK